MTTFTSFPSLDNTYQEKLIHQVELLGLHTKPYMVTEKLHGANFSFWVSMLDNNEVNIQCARRTDFIEDGEKFFNFRPVLEKYRNRLVQLHGLLKGDFILYGELFGGNVAAGMCYPLDQDFAGFDIVMQKLNAPLDKLDMRYMLDAVGIPAVPFIGVYPTLSEALAVNESFTSKLIREGFDGSEAHMEAEGIVIEPITPEFFNSGSRIYFKKKTTRFLEKGGNKIPKPKEALPPELESILLQSFEYITKPRFEAVASKIGEVSIKDIGKLTGLLTQDILTDMQKDELEVPDNKQFMKLLQGQVQNFIRPVLLSL